MNNGKRYELQNKRTLGRSLLLLTATMWLCGCAAVSAKGSWQDGVAHRSFSRVLIVGVSPDRNLRCAYESTFASQLKSESTTVFSSCDLMNSKQPLTRENLESVIASVHADAVLATRLVSLGVGQAEGTSMDMRGDSRYKAIDYGYGVYGMPVTYGVFQTAPPLSSITNTIHIVTRLYATSDATLLYTLDTTTKSREVDSTQATLSAITAPTAQRLRSDGLVR